MDPCREKHKYLLFGPLRSVTFCPGTLRPATDKYVRKPERPRLEWATEVCKLALQATGSFAQLEQSINNENCWRDIVAAYSL